MTRAVGALSLRHHACESDPELALDIRSSQSAPAGAAPCAPCRGGGSVAFASKYSVAIQPGAALLIDGRARWRPAEDEGTAALARRAFVVFEYVDEGSAGALLPAVLTAARRAAAAAVWGVVPLPGEGRPEAGG